MLKSLIAKKQDVFNESTLSFRVLPFDCDINIHMNNSRYLSFMDLGRVHLMGQGKLWTQVFKNHWIPVIVSAEISFIKALKPLQKFNLVSRVIGWDENYIYMEQNFLTQQVIAASALVKGTFLINGKKCIMQEVIDLISPGTLSPPLPQAIEHWRYLTEAKKSALN